MEEIQNPLSAEALAKVENPPVIPNLIRDPSPPASNPIKPASKFSIKAIISLIIFLLLAGGAAAGYVYKDSIVSMVSKPTPTISPTPSSTEASAKADDPTVDWKTYINSAVGYSFKYPLDWHFDEENIKLYPIEFIGELTPDSPTIGINISSLPPPTGNDIREGIPLVTDWKTVKINGIQGVFYQLHQCAPQCTADTVFNIPNSEKNIRIRISTVAQEKGYIDIYNQILSTFKFIDSQTADISSWKTYEGEGFTIKYPLEFIVDLIDIKNGNISIYKEGSNDFPSEGGSEWARFIVKTEDSINKDYYKDPDYTNAKEAESFSLQNRSTSSGNNVIIKTNGNTKFYISCYLYSKQEDIKTCNQILSTFKFTE